VIGAAPPPFVLTNSSSRTLANSLPSTFLCLILRNCRTGTSGRALGS